MIVTSINLQPLLTGNLRPELLRPMLPNYRFYMGHHSYYQMETDLYAIPLEKWGRRRLRGVLGRARSFIERQIERRLEAD